MPAILQHGGQVPLAPAAAAMLPISSSTALASIVDVSSHRSTSASPHSGLFAPAAKLSFPWDHIPSADQVSAIPALPTLSGQASITSDVALSTAVAHNASAPPMLIGDRLSVALLSAFLSLYTFSQLYQHVLFQALTPGAERAEEARWLASSKSWIDRRMCGLFGLCGLSHLWNQSHWKGKHVGMQFPINGGKGKGKVPINATDFWTSGTDGDPSKWSDAERLKREIPQYVLEFAPLIHLYSGEQYWPCDIADHLVHTTPHLNYTPLRSVDDHPNLTTLADLNKWGPHVFLQSDDNVEDRPDWLGGETNIPSPEGPDDEDGDDGDDNGDDDEYYPGTKRPSKPGKYHDESEAWYDVGTGSLIDLGGDRVDPDRKTTFRPELTAEGEEMVEVPVPVGIGESDRIGNIPIHEPRAASSREQRGGRSDAPVVLVVVDKGKGVVDAFWFFFYCFNLGNTVFNVRCGNHVGDWEHTVIRFHNGEPKAAFFSEHSFGEAYAYHALERIGKRPVGYSATGTHAMYATPGEHPYVLPYGMLKDVTDRGPLWDPLLNFHSYTYDYANDDIRSSNFSPKAPTDWFKFIGHWGDKFYPLSDPRQYRIFGQYHYVNGPLGPRFKNLGRKKICQGNGDCKINHWIGGTTKKARRWVDVGEGETMSEEDMRRLFPRGLPQEA